MGFPGQGATEYLVLLAVVLIVALVSVALLGFFPGMASDAQLTQSRMYWQSSAPISIVEMDIRPRPGFSGSISTPYFRIRNSGAYPVRLTKLIAGGYNVSQVLANGASVNISDYYYMASGEEKYFGSNTYSTPSFGVPAEWYIDFRLTAGEAQTLTVAGTALCTNDTSGNRGTVTLNSFGFEYIEYLDGNQQITKREIGAKPLVIKCT